MKPGGGWPVLIFQHGLTRNRLDAVGVADAFAGAGYVVVSIDLPLHGVAGADAAANPFYQAGHELTFDVDYLNNDTLAAGPDGLIDPSGLHFVNLTAPVLSRDNLRQGAVDLLALTRSLADLDLDGVAGGDIDTGRIHFLGHSLGGITGGVYLGTADPAELQTAVLAMAGGGVGVHDRGLACFRPTHPAGIGSARHHARLDALRAVLPRRADHCRCG